MSSVDPSEAAIHRDEVSINPVDQPAEPIDNLTLPSLHSSDSCGMETLLPHATDHPPTDDEIRIDAVTIDAGNLDAANIDADRDIAGVHTPSLLTPPLQPVPPTPLAPPVPTGPAALAAERTMPPSPWAPPVFGQVPPSAPTTHLPPRVLSSGPTPPSRPEEPLPPAAAIPSSSRAPGQTPPNDGKGRSWLRPALVGGVIGAMVSSGVLGAALVATRRDANKSVAVGPNRSVESNNQLGAPKTKTTPISASAAGTTGSLNVPEILSKVQPSTVSISTKGFPIGGFFEVEAQQGAGTGIIVTADGYVLTNAHVIENAQTITVSVPGRDQYTANVVGRDTSNDIALVKIDGVDDLPAATLGQSSALVVGEPVVAIGNALNLGTSPTVTTGIVSAIERSIEGNGERLEGLIQTDAAINPGNSGGPLVNAKGEVVGMNTAIYRGSNNIGFAIAMDRITPIVERIRKGESAFVPRTFLGVTSLTMTEELQRLYNLSTATGALIRDVVSGSPAENGGLQAGDIITSFDGTKVSDNQQLGELVRQHQPGDVVSVEWKRGSQTIAGKITLGAASVR